MHSPRSSSRSPFPSLGYLTLCAALSLVGCASPGPPRAPSLQLPQPVRDLAAQRVGDTVELRFTLPSNSTDKLPLRGPTLSGQICRQLPHQPCTPVGPRLSITLPTSGDRHDSVTEADQLPSTLTDGAPQILAYRIEFFSPAGRSAGPSNPAFTASGHAPPPVEGLHAQGSRQGIILQWTPASGDVVLQRENLGPAKPKTPSTVWLQTNDANGATGSTLDTTALPDTPYRYVAQRRTTLHLANHAIELRSTLSSPITITLAAVYPPPAPTGLTAAGYTTGIPPAFAVDLIWQPVNEANLVSPFAGYNLYRENLNATPSDRHKLNGSPILQPAFHDATADPAATYRYSVTTVDANGNESPSATVLLAPAP